MDSQLNWGRYSLRQSKWINRRCICLNVIKAEGLEIVVLFNY